MIDVRKRLIINERIKAMEMLLDAEWIPPFTSNHPGYFKGKDGRHFNEEGYEVQTPWMIGWKKNGTE